MGIKSNYKQAYFYNVFDRTGSDILPVVSIDATGGTITTPGDGYKYHFITAPGQNFVVSDAGTSGGEIEVFLVGGGGSGETKVVVEQVVLLMALGL